MTVPTYDQARELLREAERDRDLAHEATEAFRRDWRYRTAFDTLFDAARYAAMTFLSTENARWGQLRRQLPPSFSKRFRQLINTLHIQYGYGGNYPGDTPDEAFARWRDTVSRFIEDLENATLAHTEEPP